MVQDDACLFQNDGKNFSKPPECPSERKGPPETTGPTTSKFTITDTTTVLATGTKNNLIKVSY